MPEHAQTHRLRLALESSRAEGEQIEILAISAGTGNGWEFPAQVLRESLSLWDGVESYIDHAVEQRSLRDLAGVCSAPRWDEEHSGICLMLTPLGPSADLLRQTAVEACKAHAAQDHIGFSADLLFSAQGQTVTHIEKVFSVDLVV